MHLDTQARYVNVAAHGYAPWQERFDGSQQEVVARLESGRVLVGTVVSLEGRPVPDARVIAHAPSNRAAAANPLEPPYLCAGDAGGASQAWTDAAGRFTLRGLPPETPLAVWASKPGWIPRNQLEATVEASTSEAKIEMLPTLELVVGARDGQTGAPIPFRPRYTMSLPANWYTAPPRGLPGLAGRADATARSPRRLRLRLFLYPSYDGPFPRPEDCVAKLTLHAPGYQSVEEQIVLQPGQTVTHVARMARSPRPSFPLRLRARLGDAPYEGNLVVRIVERDVHGGDLHLGDTLVQFEGGTSSRDLRLPRGRYGLRPVGDPLDTTLASVFWDPAGESVDVDNDGSRGVCEVELTLRGAPVHLRVVDTKGSGLRGFGLFVGRGGSVRDGLTYWDAIRLSSAERAHEGPPAVIWLPPGETTLYAELPGVGRGRTQLRVGSDGTHQTATIELGE